MSKLKTYTCEINLKFTDNSLVSHSKEEYIEDLKELFLDDYGIFLTDDEISNIQITKEEEVWLPRKTITLGGLNNDFKRMEKITVLYDR